MKGRLIEEEAAALLTGIELGFISVEAVSGEFLVLVILIVGEVVAEVEWNAEQMMTAENSTQKGFILCQELVSKQGVNASLVFHHK